jgi:t-SNARE complex subunit (syntaxin)
MDHHTGNNNKVADTIDSPITLSIKCNNNCNKCHIYKSKSRSRSKMYRELCFIIFCILVYIIFIITIIILF